MSLRGYCRTLSDRIDCSPAIRITRLTTIERTGRLIKRSVNRILPVLWFRSFAVRRLDLVINRDRGAVAKFEHARRHYLFATLQAGKKSNLIAPRWTDLHELLSHSAIRLALRVSQIRYDEDRVAVGRIADRRARQRHDALSCTDQQLGLNEHSGPKGVPGIRKRGLHLNIARRFIHDGVEGGHSTGEFSASGAALY